MAMQEDEDDDITLIAPRDHVVSHAILFQEIAYHPDSSDDDIIRPSVATCMFDLRVSEKLIAQMDGASVLADIFQDHANEIEDEYGKTDEWVDAINMANELGNDHSPNNHAAYALLKFNSEWAWACGAPFYVLAAEGIDSDAHPYTVQCHLHINVHSTFPKEGQKEQIVNGIEKFFRTVSKNRNTKDCFSLNQNDIQETMKLLYHQIMTSAWEP